MPSSEVNKKYIAKSYPYIKLCVLSYLVKYLESNVHRVVLLIYTVRRVWNSIAEPICNLALLWVEWARYVLLIGPKIKLSLFNSLANEELEILLLCQKYLYLL